MAAAQDTIIYQPDEGPGPPLTDEDTRKEQNEIIDLICTGTLAAILNGTHIMFGILIAKVWKDKQDLKKEFLEKSGKQDYSTYEEKVFQLLHSSKSQERSYIKGQFENLKKTKKAKDFEDSELLKNASFNDNEEIAELQIGLIHQLFLARNLTLDSLKSLVDLTEIEGLDDGFAYHLNIVMEAGQKLKGVKEEQMQAYIDAYESIKEHLLNLHLEGIKSLDQKTRDSLERVLVVHQNAMETFKQLPERDSKLELDVDMGVSLLQIDEMKNAVLETLERGTHVPQILAELMVGLAYAIDIDVKVQKDMNTKLSRTKNYLKPHVTYRGHDKGKRKYFDAGVFLHYTLVTEHEKLQYFYKEIEKNNGQCSDGRKGEILASLDKVNKAIKSFYCAKKGDRKSYAYKYCREAFESEQKQMKPTNFCNKLKLIVAEKLRKLRVGIIHELLVDAGITLGAWEIIDFLSKSDDSGRSKQSADDIQKVSNSYKHHFDPLADVNDYLKVVQDFIPYWLEKRPELLHFYTEKWLRQTLQKYVDAFETGRKWLEEHTTECPRLKNQLEETISENEELKRKLAKLQGGTK